MWLVGWANNRNATMSVLGALIFLIQPVVVPAEFGGRNTATIFATIDRSEWCPAGNVRVDLVTGRFALSSGAPRDVCKMKGFERPIKDGKLDDAELSMLQKAYTSAQEQGLNLCIDGKPPENIIVSNGGPALLVLTDSARTAAPDNLSCWTVAATGLAQTLEQLFGARAHPSPAP